MPIFKAEAEGDVLYIEAADLAAAKKRFTAEIGEVLEGLVKWTEVDSVPEDEELL